MSQLIVSGLTQTAHSILHSNHLAQDVPQLAPVEAFLVVKEIGFAHAAPIIANMTQEQIQTCIDLDCWSQEHLNTQELEQWLTLLMQESVALSAQFFDTLDQEVQTAYIISKCWVHEAVEAEDLPEPPEGCERLHTPDGFFVIETKEPQDQSFHVFDFIKGLYQRNAEEAFRLLTSARWELLSSTEEEAFRFRTSRLAELGFPPFETAVSIFAKPRTQIQRIEHHHLQLPIAYFDIAPKNSLFQATLKQLEQHSSTEAIRYELCLLVQAALVAYQEFIHDYEVVQNVNLRVQDTLSLGLEILQTEHAQHAEHALQNMSLFDIFRYGYQAVLPIQKAAQQLAQDPIISHWLHIEEHTRDEDFATQARRHFMQCLLKPRPLFGIVSKEGSFKTKAFSSLADLNKAHKMLDTLANSSHIES